MDAKIFDLFEEISLIGNGDVFERLLDKLTIQGMFYKFQDYKKVLWLYKLYKDFEHIRDVKKWRNILKGVRAVYWQKRIGKSIKGQSLTVRP